jgi:hypothetical protein
MLVLGMLMEMVNIEMVNLVMVVESLDMDVVLVFPPVRALTVFFFPFDPTCILANVVLVHNSGSWSRWRTEVRYFRVPLYDPCTSL